jgi:hypothetical protein
MKLTTDQINEVEQMAALLFSPKEVLIIIGVFDQSRIVSQLTDKDFSLAYQKGKLKSEAEILKSIIELAKNGSAPAQMLADKIITQSKLNDIDV